ncbi:MAG: type IV toxin-antitoxin system AbiEi family antitoxin domain-containing protein [Mycoplasmoidaceae bacterium]
MILTTQMLNQKYQDYSSPKDKIYHLVKDKKLFPIIRGIYETDPNASPFYIANAIYGPSYISFNSALAYYGMIPEATYNTTCATYNLRKSRSYKNKWGTFFFNDVPKKAYPLGINTITENNNTFYMATREKALCDQLYHIPPCQGLKHLIYTLFEDMRLDQEQFNNLNRQDIYELADLYHCTNVRLLAQYLRRVHHE